MSTNIGPFNSSTQPQRLARLGFVLFATLLMLHASVGRADSGTWLTNSFSGSWTSAANWANGVIADGSGFAATFVGYTPTANTVTLDGDRTIGNLTFSVLVAPVNSWIIDPGNGGILTLAGGTPAINVNNQAVINVELAGTAGLTKAGNGKLTNTVANTYSGGTIINGSAAAAKSVLALSGAGTLGDTSGPLTVRSNAILNLGGTSQTVGAVSITNGAVIESGTLNGSSYAAKGGVISAALGGGGALTQSGNTLALSGVNTFTGSVLINGGTLQLGGGTAGTLSSASSITATNDAQLVYTMTTPATNNAPLTLTGVGSGGIVRANMGALVVNGNGGNLTQNGDITLASATPGADVRIGGYGGNVIFTVNLNGVISGPGSLNLHAQGGVGQFFLNNSSTYAGNTTLRTIGANNLTTLGVDNALPVTTVLTNDAYQADAFTNYSQLILGGHQQTLAGIVSIANVNGIVTNRITGGSGTLSTLTISNTSANSTFIGVLGGFNANDNNLALVKAGTKTLTLTRDNTLAGPVLITGGSLLLSGGSLASASSITVTNTAQLVYNTTTSVTNTAPLTLTGDGSGGSNPAGQQYGALAVYGDGGHLFQNSDIVLEPANSGDIVRIGGYGALGAFACDLNGAISGPGSLSLWAQGGMGQFFLNNNFTYTGNTILDTVAANNLTTLGVDNALPTTSVLTNGFYASGGYTNLSYYGQLALNGHNQTLAGIVSGNEFVANRIVGGGATLSTLTINNAVDCAYKGVLGGPNADEDNLALVKSGAGALSLDWANTYAGTTTINGGTLLVNGSLAGGAVQVNGNGTLGGTGTIGGPVTFETGAMALFTNGGTLAISGALTANGNVVHLNLPSDVPMNTYLLATYSGGSGSFASTPVVDSGSFAAGTTNYITTAGGQVNLVVQIANNPPAATNIAYSVSGSQLVLDWPAGQGWQLQGQTNNLNVGLGTNWSTIPGATPPFTNSINATNPTVFYRLFYPAP